MNAYAAAILLLAGQSSLAPAKPPFVGTESELNDKALGEEISRTEQTRQFSPVEIEEELARQANCLVLRRSGEVDELLVDAASAKAFKRNGQRLFTDEVCRRPDFVVNYDASTFRGALITARYRLRYQDPIESEVDVGSLQSAVAASQQLGGEADELILRKLAFCVIQFGPEKAHAFVEAALRSPEEKSALDELKQAIGQCVPPGEQVGFNRTILRGLLAESLDAYRSAGAHNSIRGGEG